jgi:hypothetical protein
MSIEAMKQALGFLEHLRSHDKRNLYGLDEDITALRTAIEQAEKPVCEVLNERGEVDYISYVPPVGTPLYTAPRQWVGLTRNEAMEIVNSLVGQDWTYAVDAIETKLKEKNV